jgi:DNA-binding NarL/FixJ family response regulator
VKLFGKIKVLIVDDSPLIVAKVTEMFEEVEIDAELKSCGSFKHAIEIMKVYEPDIFLLDINLPDRSGIELLQVSKKNFPNSHFIMVTNQSHEQYRNICYNHGASSFLDKSNQFHLIPHIISSLSA